MTTLFSCLIKFSYCTINGYDGFPIVLEDDMTEVKNINALFYKCKGIDNLGNNHHDTDNEINFDNIVTNSTFYDGVNKIN